jgi:integrase
MSKPQRTATGWSIQLRFGKGRRKRFAMPRLSSHATEDETLANARGKALEELAAMLGGITQLDASALLEFAASRETEKGFQSALRAARQAAVNPDAIPAPEKRWTFRDVAEEWLSGRLHREYPEIVTKGKGEHSVNQSRGILRAIYGVQTRENDKTLFGDLDVRTITKADVVAAKSKATPADVSQATRAGYARHIRIVMGLAVAPLELIEASPVPAKFVPSYGFQRALSYLYPEEDAILLGAPDDVVPWAYRFFYGFRARNGLRIMETLRLVYGDFDLRQGILTLDVNKTNVPRAWKMSDDCTRVLAAEKKRRGASDEDLVFPEIEHDDLSGRFREHLWDAGVRRRELHRDTPQRRPIRVYDQRAGFVTIAMGSGATEDWVMRRTGHTTSAMLAKYRRQVEHAREVDLGWYLDLEYCLSGQAARDLEGVARGVARREKIRVNLPGFQTSAWSYVPLSNRTDEPKTPASAQAPALDEPRETSGWHAPHQGVAHESAEQQRSMSAPEDTPADPVATALAQVELTLARAIDRATEAGEWATVRILAAELEARRKSREAQRTAGVTSIDAARVKREKNGEKP